MAWIALTGRARAGKDTFANVAVTEFGYHRVAFADAVRDMALVLDPLVKFDYPHNHLMRLSELVALSGWDHAKDDPEVRRILQVLGTDVVRNTIDRDYWLDEGIYRAEKAGPSVVFTDVRFSEERSRVRAVAVKLLHYFSHVHIDRPGTNPAKGHASESYVESGQARDDAYVVIDNYKGLDVFENRVRSQLRMIEEAEKWLSTSTNAPYAASAG